MTGFPDRSRSWVADEVLSVLQCVSCSGSFNREESELGCTGCVRRHARLNGIARFVGAPRDAGGFGFQWQRHAWDQSKPAHEGVFRWFENYSFEDLRVVSQPIAVMGRRPASSQTRIQ